MRLATEKTIREHCSASRRDGPTACEGFLPGVTAKIRRVQRPAGYVVEIVDQAGRQRKRFGTVNAALQARRVGVEAGSGRLTVGDDWIGAFPSDIVRTELGPRSGYAEQRELDQVGRTCERHPDATACSSLCFGELPDPNDRRAWLEWRRGGLGGSDVAAILGLSPWSGPFDVWISKTQPLGDEAGNASTRRGHILESAILQHAAAELGAILLPGEAMQNEARPWHRATPDGYLDFPRGARVGIEGKSTRAFDVVHGWGPSGSGEVPLGYRIQCAWYMAATGLSTWFLAAFATLSDEFRLYRIERDEQVERVLVTRAWHWWQKHVENGEPPELDTSEAAGRYLHEKHTPPGEQLAKATTEQAELALRWNSAKAVEKQATADRKQIEVELKQAVGDAAGLFGDWGRVKWSRFERSSLDAKRLRAERPELGPVLDEYTRTNPSSRFSAKFTEETK